MITDPCRHPRRSRSPNPFPFRWGSQSQDPVGLYKIFVGIDKIEGILKFSTVLGKCQGLADQTAESLAKGQIIAFDVGSINLACVPISSFQRSS